MTFVTAGRADLWEKLPVPEHLRLVDAALDANDVEHKNTAEAIAALEKSTTERLTKILWAVVSLSLSFAAAAATLVLTVLSR